MQGNLINPLLAIALMLSSGTNQLFAVTKLRSQEHINVELSFAETDHIAKAIVPIYRNSKEVEPISAGFATVDDFSCKLTCEVDFFLFAYAVSESEARLSIDLSFGGKYKKCEVHRETTIVRGKRINLKLKCGAQMMAYFER